MPPGRPARGAARASPLPGPDQCAGSEDVTERFAHVGGAADQLARYFVDHRPQDNMRHHGRLLEYAVVDREDGKPVAWCSDRDWAEHTADTATRLRES